MADELNLTAIATVLCDRHGRGMGPMRFVQDEDAEAVLRTLVDEYGIDLSGLTPDPGERYDARHDANANAMVLDTWTHHVVATFGTEIPDNLTAARDLARDLNEGSR